MDCQDPNSNTIRTVFIRCSIQSSPLSQLTNTVRGLGGRSTKQATNVHLMLRYRMNEATDTHVPSWLKDAVLMENFYPQLLAACPVENHQHFRGHHLMEAVKHIRNVGKCIPDYKVQQPRSQSYSYSSPFYLLPSPGSWYLPTVHINNATHMEGRSCLISGPYKHAIWNNPEELGRDVYWGGEPARNGTEAGVVPVLDWKPQKYSKRSRCYIPDSNQVLPEYEWSNSLRPCGVCVSNFKIYASFVPINNPNCSMERKYHISEVSARSD